MAAEEPFALRARFLLPVSKRPVAHGVVTVARGRIADVGQRTHAARVVDLRFFGGLTEVEVAGILSVSERTVRNDWSMARAWLRCELGGGSQVSER